MFKIKEDYIISINSKQNSIDGNNEINVKMFGTYIKKGDKKYIMYKEYGEGNPENYTVCIIKIEKQDTVTLIRNSKYQTRLILEKSQRHYSPYYTEHGVLMTSIFTNLIEDNLESHGGTLSVSYSLDVNSSFFSSNDVKVEVKLIKKD